MQCIDNNNVLTVSFLRKAPSRSRAAPGAGRLVSPEEMGPGKIAAIGAGAAGLAAVVGAPVVLGVVGFTSAGIAAGSYAAGMMSAAAVANGGAVAAGSAVAVLQAAGAAGLSGAATAAVAGAGAAVGGAVGWLASFITKKSK